MRFRKSTLLLIALAMIAGLVGCSSSSHPITVALVSPPTSVVVNSQTPLTATVANDKANAGVTWTCTPAATCGSFSPTTGLTTTYTAPAFVANGPVTIIATSVTSPAISASDPGVTLAAASLADGTYVFSLSGEDTNSLYSVAGAFKIAGGAITEGEQDYVDATVLGTTDQINPTGSSATTSADGNLLITLVTCNLADCTHTDTNIGVAGTETLSGTVTPMNPDKALITEFDAAATSSGELNLQTSAAASIPSGGYAFGLNGFDSQGYAASTGGVINVDGSGTISGAGSVWDMNDTFQTGLYGAQSFSAGSTVSSPDAMGRVAFTLNNPIWGSFVVAGYIVDSNKIRLVENYTDGFGGTMGGTARSQGANTGTFTDASVAGQTYVVGLAGWDSCYALQLAAQLTFNADNSVTGYINYNDFCPGVNPYPTTPSPLLADPAGGTWAQDATTGRVTVTGITDGNVSFNAQFYPDGNGNVMSLSLDGGDAVGGSGVLQTTGQGTGAGPFAVSFSGWDPNAGDNFNAVGPIVSDGTASFSGFTDLSWLGSTVTYPDNTTTGTFAVDANGIDYDGTITGVDVLTCPTYGVGVTACSPDTFVFYIFDANGENLAIETDTNQMALGVIIQQ